MHPDVVRYGLDPIPLITVGAVMFVLTAVAISLRVYARGFLTRSFGWDDKLLVVAFVFYIGSCVDLILIGDVQANRGVISPSRELGKLTISGILTYIMVEIFIKLSAAIFFLRIVQESWQRRTILISVSIYVTFMVAYFFTTLFQCGNPANILIHKNCLNWDTVFAPLSYLGGALNATIDWIFVLTTTSLVTKTHMHRRAKVSVCLILSLAALGSVVSIVRIPFIRGGRLSVDQVAKAPRVTILSTVEAGLGIISLSLATLRPLVRTWMDAITSKSPSDDAEAARYEHAPPVRVQADRPATEIDLDQLNVHARRSFMKRADSHEPHTSIMTITMPAGVSGHYGVLDSVNQENDR